MNKQTIIAIIIILIILLLLKRCNEEPDNRTDMTGQQSFDDLGPPFPQPDIILTLFGGIALDDECMDACEALWHVCDDECDDLYCDEYEACFLGCDEIEEDCFDCEDICDDAAWACVVPDCVLVEETVVWDGEPVDDLGTWFGESFPGFTGIFEEACEGTYFEGYWNTESNIYGCTDADLFYYEDCEAEPLTAAQDVCETIGAVWTCTAPCDIDECAEPNAIITCSN